ncbi:MAG TPA: hypothetical protein VGD88_12475 [Opitutaceae bacterium]
MQLIAWICIPLLLLQSGCLSTIALVNGVDASISRDVRSDPGSYAIQLVYDGREPTIANLKCEQYYEAQASTRGNYWAWREVGTQSQYQAKEITLVDERMGSITFSMPTCDDLKRGSWKGGPLLVVHVDGQPYFHVRSIGDIHTYKPTGRVQESLYLNLKYTLEIEYSIDPKPPGPIARSGLGSP